ncbi:hypothetical protein KIN20_017658 [Parelaphostrongylus tenuis]|uniref:Uncharacterized protein n=1 Tax=Parelaphostrongylus tenuis TaxID=148309 RepID=A0AAD5N3C2_PARTN|nr:hypothetical protein KIN20_017658 [Parelaphostrongylus tenuis]
MSGGEEGSGSGRSVATLGAGANPIPEAIRQTSYGVRQPGYYQDLKIYQLVFYDVHEDEEQIKRCKYEEMTDERE